MARGKKRRTAHHFAYSNHHEHHSFLIIAGGGFLVILLMLLMFDNQPLRMLFAAKDKVDNTEAMEVTDQTAESSVVIENYAYTPQSVTVKAGTKLVFTNNDAVGHTATADDGTFDTGVIQPGQTEEVTLNTPGTYTYHCTLHPNMTGTIVVEE